MKEISTIFDCAKEKSITRMDDEQKEKRLVLLHVNKQVHFYGQTNSSAVRSTCQLNAHLIEQCLVVVVASETIVNVENDTLARKLIHC
jgi:hypothetical protein